MDQLAEMKVFYVNVGGGEPMVRPDFWELMQGAVARGIGVKFSTNGTRLGLPEARRLAAMRHVDVQVSLDGATAPVNDRLRGAGSFDRALAALDALALAGFAEPKISVVVTRENASQLDHFKALADRHGAVLRLTRLRPAGRGARIWEYLRPTADQLRSLHEWLLAEGRAVMTGDSFFHLSAFGGRLPGMNLCAAARAVCLIDPVGGVYACPFAVDSRFRAGSLRDQGLSDLWQAPAFQALRVETVGGLCRACPVYAACGGGCPAAKFFTGRSVADPDPECVLGHSTGLGRQVPPPGTDHSRRAALQAALAPWGSAVRPCQCDPVARNLVPGSGGGASA